jgi:hypothetical protein
MGSTTLYSTSGYSNYIRQLLSRRGYLATDSSVYTAPVASAANAWDLSFIIPVAANEYRQFDVGCINLQDPQLQVSIDGTWGVLGDFCTAGATRTTALTMTGTMEFFEIPDPTRVVLPTPMLHKILESQQTITAGGEQTVTVPREGHLLRLIHEISENSLMYSPGVDLFYLRADLTDTYERLSSKDMAINHMLNYSQAMPAGVYVHEFWGAEGEPSEGDGRDFVDSMALTTFESRFTLAAGPSGTNNNINTVREFLQYPS